jgi:acetoacetyl-CoA reductase
MQVAIVTGGTRGIGAAVSVRLNSDGFAVVASFVADEEFARDFETATGITAAQWDVTDTAACAEQVARISRDIGPVSVLVNNAGVTCDSTLRRMSASDWSVVLRTNLGGAYNMARAVWPDMLERRYGRIVNISSINAQAGQFGQVNYSAAKSGLFGFTKALAKEGAAAGITVNAVAPGYINTRMVSALAPEILEGIVANIPIGRLGRPDEVARAVSFLCEEEASFITGSTLSVNGGQHMY